MLHHLSRYAILGVMVWMLASCGGDREQKDVEPDISGKEQDSVTLEAVDPTGQAVTFWYQHTREREKELQELIREFNATNPHKIKVTGEYAGRYNDIYRKMIVGIQSGAVPELLVAYQNQAAAYAMAGGLIDLTPYVKSPKWGFSDAELADFFPSFLEHDISAYMNNARLGFPPNRSMEVLYYNADWLKELGYDGPPENWDQFKEMACRAVKKPFSKATHPKVSLGFQLTVDASRFASMVFSRGGDLVNEDRSAYMLDGAVVRETLLYIQDLFDAGCAKLAAERYSDQADFAAGDLLFTTGSTSGLPFYAGAVAEGAGFDWRIAPIPHSTPHPVQNVYGASWSIPKTTREKQLATWIFLKWMTEPEQQSRWARASNYFPVRKSTAAELKDYFAENPNYELAFGLLQYGKSEPSVGGYEVVRDAIEQAVAAVIDGADLDEMLAKLQKKANETLELLRRDTGR